MKTRFNDFRNNKNTVFLFRSLGAQHRASGIEIQLEKNKQINKQKNKDKKAQQTLRICSTR